MQHESTTAQSRSPASGASKAEVAAFAAGLRARGRFMTLIMDTGNLCNVACRFCHIATEPYQRRKAENLSAAEFVARFGPILPRLEMLQLSCGAEPFMNPHFLDILRELEGFEGRVHFSTNAMLLSDAAIAAIARLREVNVAISIDGSEKATVEWLRDKVKWEKLLERTRALARARDAQDPRRITITSAYSITEQNVEEIAPFVPLAKELGFDVIRYRMVELDDLFDEERRATIPVKDLEKVRPHLARAAERGRELGIAVDLPDLDSTGSPPPAAAAEPGALREPYCRWPFDHVFVDSVNVRRKQRKVLPCPFWPDVPDDEPAGADLATISEGPFFESCREAVMDPRSVPSWCQKCPIGLKRI